MPSSKESSSRSSSLTLDSDALSALSATASGSSSPCSLLTFSPCPARLRSTSSGIPYRSKKLISGSESAADAASAVCTQTRFATSRWLSLLLPSPPATDPCRSRGGLSAYAGSSYTRLDLSPPSIVAIFAIRKPLLPPQPALILTRTTLPGSVGIRSLSAKSLR
jgi:hypothetical protein